MDFVNNSLRNDFNELRDNNIKFKKVVNSKRMYIFGHNAEETKTFMYLYSNENDMNLDFNKLHIRNVVFK